MFKLNGTKDGAKPEVWLVRDAADARRYKARLEAKGWFVAIGIELPRAVTL